MNTSVLKSFLTLRLCLVIIIQTWFVPDETWQSTEVAHYWKYGYGYLTWEWQTGIRSVFYPGLFALLFHLLAMIKVDYTAVLIISPQILSAVTFAIGDYYIVSTSSKLFGKHSSGWVAVCLASCWFLAYCSPRTLSSCAEMTCLAIALHSYPWYKEKYTGNCSYLWYIGIGFIIRPTISIVFLPFYLRHLRMCKNRIKLIWNAIVVMCAIVVLSVSVDSWFYGKFTIVPWNFFKFNILNGLSSHYGTQPWYWYFTHGIPVMCGVYLIPLLHGAFSRFEKYRILLLPCLWNIVVHSTLGHKEFRFLLPILPLLMCIAGDNIHVYLNQKRYIFFSNRRMLVLLLLIIPNVVALFYMGCIHQRGPFDLIFRLRQLVESHSSPAVLFLTPCHSTPLYSHLHLNIPVRFLTCEPNLKGETSYIDEADLFFASPLEWIQKEYISTISHKLPSHIVMYDTLEKDMDGFLKEHSYSICSTVFNTHYYDDQRGKYFLVYCR